MGRGIIYSFALHVLVALIVLTTASLGSKPKFNPDEIIKVNLASLPMKKEEPAVVAPPPKQAESKPVPAEPPKTVPKKVEAKKTEPKPKPKQTKAKQDEKQESKSESKSESPSEKQIESKAVTEGSSFRGATVDNASFNYNWWFDQAFYKIYDNYRNTVPYDGPLVCVVYFQVLKSGKMFGLQVRESSGISEFDDVCLTAIERSSPFPPLPKDFNEEVIGITVPFKYQPE